MRCFVHFDLQVCFAQRRAIFGHRNFQTCLELLIFPESGREGFLQKKRRHKKLSFKNCL